MRHTNDMLRAMGLNVPREDDNLMVHQYDWITGREVTVYVDLDERPIMDQCGWDIDSTPVDVFMEAPDHVRHRYAQGMSRDSAGL